MAYRYCTFLIFLFLAVFDAQCATPRVLVSIPPLHALATDVMKGAGEPKLLMHAQQSPHTFHLKPSDIEKIHQADLVIWVGPELEFFLEPLQKSMQHQLQVIKIENIQRLPLSTSDHHHGHHHGGSIDPHLWLNPQNAKRFVIELARILGQLDPKQAATYTKNAMIVAEELDALDHELQKALQPYQKTPFFVFHDSLQYFTNHYQLKGGHVITANPEHPITAKQFTASQKRIKTLGIRCLFQEPQFEQPILKKLAQSTDTQLSTLDPLGSLNTGKQNGYFAMMRTLTHTLASCLAQKPLKKGSQ